jgi:hypothetical protein
LPACCLLGCKLYVICGAVFALLCSPRLSWPFFNKKSGGVRPSVTIQKKLHNKTKMKTKYEETTLTNIAINEAN